MVSSAGAAHRLRVFLASNPAGVFTFDRFRAIVESSDDLELAEELGKLVNEGILEQFVRVESPQDKGRIGDFPSMLDVPLVMHDWRLDVDFVVTPDDLRLLYRLPSKAV